MRPDVEHDRHVSERPIKGILLGLMDMNEAYIRPGRQENRDGSLGSPGQPQTFPSRFAN